MNPPLSPEEVAQFRGLVKPAIVLLVMLRLDRPVGAKEIAAILDLNEHTVAGYLRALARLNLVARAGYRQGYILLGGRQLILGAERNVKKLHFNPTSTTINRKELKIRSRSSSRFRLKCEKCTFQAS